MTKTPDRFDNEENDLSNEVVEPDPANMRMRILRKTSVLPAAFTLLNAMAGFGAIHFASKTAWGIESPEAMSNLYKAVALLFAAMFCDMLDGRVARMTRSTSEFGAQLDSLCDVISFGVAPAVIALRCTIMILGEYSHMEHIVPIERMVWCMSGLYVCCAVLRLARFNVETEEDESAHMDFRGLPSPGAAFAIVSCVWLFLDLYSKLETYTWLSKEYLYLVMSILLPILTLGCGLLMVSQFKYPHIVNHYIRGRKPMNYLVKLVALVLIGVVQPYLTFAFVGTLYALSGPLGSLRRRVGKANATAK